MATISLTLIGFLHAPCMAQSRPDFFALAKSWIAAAEAGSELNREWEFTLGSLDAGSQPAKPRRFHALAGAGVERLVEVYGTKAGDETGAPDFITIVNADYIARLKRASYGWDLVELIEAGTPAWRETWETNASRGPWLDRLLVAGVPLSTLLAEQKLHLIESADHEENSQKFYRYRAKVDLSKLRSDGIESAITTFDVSQQAPYPLKRVREEVPDDESTTDFADYTAVHGPLLPQRIKGERKRVEQQAIQHFFSDTRLIRVSDGRGTPELFRLPHYGLPEPAAAIAKQRPVWPVIAILFAALALAGWLLRRSQAAVS
jgi:hypothetical protein